MKILIEKSVQSMISPMTTSQVNNLQIHMFDVNVDAAFDAFDISKPNVFITKASKLKSSVVKNLLDRPDVFNVIVNDDAEKFDDLVKQIGKPFIELPNEPFCDIDATKKAKFTPEFDCDIICVEGTDVPPIDSNLYHGRRLKIFSSKAMIQHKYFCGFIDENEKFNAWKTAPYSIVPTREVLNVFGCGSLPIVNGSTVSRNDYKWIDNYEISKNILDKLGVKI